MIDLGYQLRHRMRYAARASCKFKFTLPSELFGTTVSCALELTRECTTSGSEIYLTGLALIAFYDQKNNRALRDNWQ
jgi:hypothetical protein